VDRYTNLFAAVRRGRWPGHAEDAGTTAQVLAERLQIDPARLASAATAVKPPGLSATGRRWVRRRWQG